MDSSTPLTISELTSSSGDLIADQRFEFGLQLRARGEPGMAADVIAQALDLAPLWPEARFALAETLALAGQGEAAITAYRAYLDLDAGDSMGAAARMHLLGGLDDVPNLSAAYVRRLFDQYAPRFEDSLVERLQYSVPAAFRRMIDTAAPGRRFGRALDLGCGTGLVGAAVRDLVDRLDGIDLSPGMIALSARKNIYDRLWEADVGAAMTSIDRYDLILAGDVLCYIRDLAPVLSAARDALNRGAPKCAAMFAFSLEHGDGDGVALYGGQRYRHGAALVDRLIAANGYTVRSQLRAPIRLEGDGEIIGNIYLLSV